MTSSTLGRVALLGAAAAFCAAAGLGAQSSAPARVTDGASFVSSGAVVRPVNYREWVYLTSGLGMSYAPEALAEQAAQGRPPVFDNVFVNPQSYRAFVQSGRWPEGTMFILELRRGERHVSIDTGGQTQGVMIGIEAAVKDSTRFAATGGWAYFGFGRVNALAESATPNPPTASCYACHGEHTAVENTFVQFYPTLFEVAQRLGTVKSTYDPKRTVR
ncbi:MAG TPA: cytochrome P460 family protein [Vicinamibacterales bacterium]|nr:cytochrome P460 family protein [Vicinamibacterales bacterium]